MTAHDHPPTADARPAPAGTIQTRREFLRAGSLLGAACAWTLPSFLNQTLLALHAQAADRSAVQTATGKDQPILVVLQLAGGNDGLNTLVPFADDAYHRARPTLGLPANQVLRLTDYVGLHPHLAPLRALYDQGHVALVQGVGYPNPNRSHFRSTEIWQTASDEREIQRHGWLGRYFDHCCQGADPAVGVAIGGQLPQAFAAAAPTGISFANPEQYRWVDRATVSRRAAGSGEEAFRALNSPEEPEENGGGSIGRIDGAAGPGLTGPGALDFLERTALDAQVSSEQVLRIARERRPLVGYPPGALGANLGLVARMIAGGLPTRVFYVSQGGYDTHQGQLPTHQRLMQELGDAVGAFCADLKAQGNFGRVVLMTFSEFGRRVTQNASGGTDHGAAAPLFLVGGGVRGGLYGRYPSLSALSQGDLVYNVDFRSVYATLLERWLHVPSAPVLGRRFANLPVLA